MPFDSSIASVAATHSRARLRARDEHAQADDRRGLQWCLGLGGRAIESRRRERAGATMKVAASLTISALIAVSGKIGAPPRVREVETMIARVRDDGGFELDVPELVPALIAILGDENVEDDRPVIERGK